MSSRYLFKACIGDCEINEQNVLKNLFERNGEINHDMFGQFNNLVYGADIDLQMWFPIYQSALSYRNVYFKAARGLFLIFNQSRKNSLEEMRELIEKIISVNDFVPAVVILGLKLRNPFKNELNEAQIKNFIDQLQNDYELFIPYVEIEEKEGYKFDTLIVKDLIQTLTKLIYFKWIREIDIRDNTKFIAYDFLFNLNKDNELDKTLVAPLKDYLENSQDEMIELVSLDELRKIYEDKNYFHDISSRINLFPNTRNLASLLYLEDKDKINEIIFNSEYTKTYTAIIIDLLDDTEILKNICLNHQEENLKEKALEKLITLNINLSDKFLKSIIWNSDNIKMEELGVQYLDNEEELNEIILEHPNNDIKINAIKKLKVPIAKKIKDIVNKKKYYKPVKEEVISKMDSDNELEAIVLGENYLLRPTALNFIKKPRSELVEKIVYGDFQIELQLKAIEKCSDQKLLEKILMHHQMLLLRFEALEYLKDPPLLFLYKFVFEIKNPDQRLNIIKRMKIDDNLSSNDFQKILKITNNENTLESLITNCKSIKHLGTMRLTLPENFQSLIKKRLGELTK